MRNVYPNEEALQADAKVEKAKVVVDSEAAPFPPDTHRYYKAEDGQLHRQLKVVDGAHVVLHGVLVHVDDAAPIGTAGTLKMPVTGNVLSVPRHDVGESFAGYYLRTSKQHGGAPHQVGELQALAKDEANLADAPVVKDDAGVPIPKFVPQRTGTALIDWPLMADWFANRGSYERQANVPAGAGVLTPAHLQPAATSIPTTTTVAEIATGTERTNPVTGAVEVFDGSVWRDKLTGTPVAAPVLANPVVFPPSPVKNQQHTDAAGTVWVYDGVVWRNKATGAAA